MTADLARTSDTAPAVAGNTSDALARLADWVDAARNAHQLVAPLVDTAFVPDAYKPKADPRATPEQRKAAYDVAVANATAAVLQGLSLGLDPLVSLQQIYIVHGRPGMYAKLMVALIQAHGHEVWTEDLTDTRAVVCGRRKSTEYVERITVTMDQARKAGWTRNDNYAKTPQDMLWSRAVGRVCDRIASDVLKGIASIEQIQDENAVTAESTGTRTVVAPRRRVAPAPAIQAAVDEPPLDEDPAVSPRAPVLVEEPAATGESRITYQQMSLLQTLFAEQPITGPQAKRDYCTQVLGRTITSVKDLSKADAGKVIDALTPVADPEPAFDDDAWIDPAVTA